MGEGRIAMVQFIRKGVKHWKSYYGGGNGAFG